MPPRNTTPKPAAKKAPAKRTPPRPATRQAKVAKFEEFRRRAEGLNVSHLTPGPVEIGPDQGFDPPLIARWPSKLADQVLLDAAAETGKPDLVLLHLLGQEQLLRVARMFAPLPDSDDLFVGLTMWLWDQFLGPGAGDVPGGTQASSTP